MSEWIKAETRLPNLGQKIILFSNGAVQEETYELGIYDESYPAYYIWMRDELDDYPIVNFEKDEWQPLPEPPKTPENNR